MDSSSLHLIYEAHTLVERAAVGGNSTDPSRPPVYKAVGLTLAVASGLLIGSSFVLKKTGLLRANEKYNEEAGEGYGYLKNAYWWAGMSLMILGEICNFVAYAFVDAILVTPLGALSVVVTTILSAIFLKERLSFVGKIGCFNCIIGSIVIVMNAPEQSAVADIQEMKDFVIHPGFLSYAGVVIVGCAFIALWVAPRYGKKSMLVYLTICSLIGGLSVVATQGLGSAIVAQAGGKPQFNQWFLYVLLVFVVATLLTEIIYLNKALNLFNAALVTPTYYVIFTTATIVTSAVLFRGFHGTPISIATVIMGFLQICAGVVLLQLSKSAKDVPDSAVFRGDLDQMREMGDQEQPESEPKADAIRGTAAIIRRISASRAKMEQAEFRRLHDEKQMDHLEPVKENEIVEWDGLRRRKTIIGDPGVRSPIVRRKTIHPPLGMSYFPAEEEDNGEERERAQTHGGFLENIRHRASSVLHPFSPRADHDHPQSPMHPVALTDIQVHPSKTDSPVLPYGVDGHGPAEEHVYGLPAGLRKPNFDSKPMPSPRSKPLPDKPESLSTPPLSPHTTARRQFSFTNFLGRNQRSTTPMDHIDDLALPPSRSGIGSRGSSHTHEQKKAMKNATEEERLGLVKGDSHHALLESSPERAPHALQSIPSRARSSSTSSDNSVIEDDGGAYDPYSYRSRAMASSTQSRSYGRQNVPYVRTHSTPDSDGDDDWQITTPPTDSNSQRQQGLAGSAGGRNQVLSVEQVQQQQRHQAQPRPSSRKRPSPPRNYQAPTSFPSTFPSLQVNIPAPTSAVAGAALPIQRQRSHSKTASGQQVAVTQAVPPARMGSSRSRNLSTNQARTTTTMATTTRDQEPRHHDQQERGRKVGVAAAAAAKPQREYQSSSTGTTTIIPMPREQSPEDMTTTTTVAAGAETRTVTAPTLMDIVSSKKRFEMQSAQEREERRKRMSSGWVTSTGTGTGQSRGAGSGPAAEGGSGGGDGNSSTISSGGFI